VTDIPASDADVNPKDAVGAPAADAVRDGDERGAGPRHALSPTARRLVILGFALSGAAALIYEVAWTRELSLVFSSTVYAVSTMLAAFMTGLSIGGWLGGRRADKSGTDPVRDLATVELGIAITGLMSPITLRVIPMLQYEVLTVFKPAPLVFFALQMLLAFVVMLVPTTLMGMTFPLASKISTTSYSSLGRTVGGLYSANTLGAIAGSLGAGFLLIPIFGLRASILFAGAINLVVACLIMAASRKPAIFRVGAALALVLVIGIGDVALPQTAVPLSLGTAYRFASYEDYVATSGAEDVSVIWAEENAYSRVEVVEEPGTGFRFLVNGSLVEGSNGRGDAPTTSLLSYLPAAYADKVDDVLVIGLGTGYTSASALRLPARSVTTVEINPAMREAASYFVGDTLEGDERWRLVNADARQQLQVADTNYDIITSEPSWPLAAAVSPLFTREFFELAESRLADGGVFCQWLPGYLLSHEDQAMMVHTVGQVFGNVHVWEVTVDGAGNGDILVIACNAKHVDDSEVVRERVAGMLAADGLTGVSAQEIPLSEFLGGASERAALDVNTDDHPLLEFRVPIELVEMVEGLRTP